MSGNHQNSLISAREFVHSAALHGAQLLKFQVYTPDTITFNSPSPLFRVDSKSQWSEYTSLYDLYSAAYTPWEWISDLFSLSRSLDIVPFASPFDTTAVDFLESLDCPIYKIASPEITDLGLIEACCNTGKPIILSTGLASLVDLELAVDFIKQYGNKFMILKCVSAYPTPITDINLATIPWLREKFSCPVGLSDHTLGTSVPLASVALGSSLIEKHFKLPSDTLSVDASFSLSLDTLPSLTTSITEVHTAIGTPTLIVPESAEASMSGRRSLFAVKDINIGEPFSISNIRSIRPSYGLHPKHLKLLLGHLSPISLQAGEPLPETLLQLLAIH